MKMPSVNVNLVCAYSICSGHRLYRDDWSAEKNQTAFGKCTNDHGHQYTIELHLTGPLDEDTGMLINGFAVDEIVKPLIFGQLDHKFLNRDVAFFKAVQPTAEWLAYYIFRELQAAFPTPVQLKSVRVRETAELYAEYPAA
jgi:6-pyruvoyltetrahydropterin/6-carboxytetrahydropterin synthase